MATVKITEAKLRELRMLSDWQLREQGFDPESVTAVCEESDGPSDAEIMSALDFGRTAEQHLRY